MARAVVEEFPFLKDEEDQGFVCFSDKLYKRSMAKSQHGCFCNRYMFKYFVGSMVHSWGGYSFCNWLA